MTFAPSLTFNCLTHDFSDWKKEVPQVKMIDKLSFTFGVLCICGSEWLTLRHADWFPLYYSVVMTCLLLWRLITYTKDKYQLFMLGHISLRLHSVKITSNFPQIFATL